MSYNERKVIDKRDEEPVSYERKQAQRLSFEQLEALLQRNVKQATRRSYTQYTKEAIKTYLQNPSTGLDNIREISRFLERNSMLYKKLLIYYASLPLYNYTLTQMNDWTKSVNSNKQIKSFQDTAYQVHGFDMKVSGFLLNYLAIRDGMSVGFTYTYDDKTFFQYLDPQYCRVYGKNTDGQWIVYFNAGYFAGNNLIYVEGIEGDTSGCWDQVFIDGYNAYQADRQNAQWFELPPERTCCQLSVTDDFADVPLPFFAPMFLSLVDLSDYEDLIADKTELENYKLLVNKIPMKDGSDMVNDFALSMELAQKFDNQFQSALPNLVGHVLSPGFDIDVIDFEKSNTTDYNDILSQSIENIFNQTGISQIVVAGGKSTNSVGLKHAIQNDISVCWNIWINRFESWINYWIKSNVSDSYHFAFLKESWYNRDEFITEQKDLVALGGPVLPYLCAMDKTPYIAYQEMHMDEMLGLKDLFRPLATSYTTSASDVEGGRPQSDEGDLTDSGIATRDGDKNAGTKANS